MIFNKITRYGALAFGALAFAQCAESLDVTNENEPPFDVLTSEEGLQRLALGIWFFDDGQNIGDFNWITQTNHSIMGDETYCPFGNFTWRWQNQPTSITFNGGATTFTPPQGADQPTTLNSFNDRAQVDNNAYAFEWRAMYRANNTANLILSSADAATFANDPEATKASYKAWGYFWKGWAYSRLGSMYGDGLIIDEFGTTNSDYVPNTALIAEATENFDLALAELNKTNDGAWTLLTTVAIPDYMRIENGNPTLDDMRAMINTMKARNILVNRRVRALATNTVPQISAADYQAILALTENGIQADGNWIQFRSAESNGVFDQTIWPPYRAMIGWLFMSERLVQDFKPGDLRRARNVDTLATPFVNQRGRGIQYGTRYGFVAIENGGDYATTEVGLAKMPMAGSYDENALMRAEALIQTGAIEDGLALIEEVRESQDAGLSPVVGTGLNADQAYEELRKERRIGLIFQGLQFYDARRWGVTVPVALGGGRSNAVVIGPTGTVFNDATFNYNYLDYFGVPDDELDFNETDRANVASVPAQ